MENSEEKNLLQGSIKETLWENMTGQYQRSDAEKDTVVTFKNEGPGELKCLLTYQGNDDFTTQKTLRSGDTWQINALHYRFDGVKVQTSYQKATFTIDNVKR